MSRTTPIQNGHGIEGALRAGIARAETREQRADLAGPLAAIMAAKRGRSVAQARAAATAARKAQA